MKRFKSATGQAQRFLSAHDQINNLFHLRRDHLTADQHRAARTQAFQILGRDHRCSRFGVAVSASGLGPRAYRFDLSCTS